MIQLHPRCYKKTTEGASWFSIMIKCPQTSPSFSTQWPENAAKISWYLLPHTALAWDVSVEHILTWKSLTRSLLHMVAECWATSELHCTCQSLINSPYSLASVSGSATVIPLWVRWILMQCSGIPSYCSSVFNCAERETHLHPRSKGDFKLLHYSCKRMV